MNVFVFDIETIPDVAGGRKIYGLNELDDEQVAKAMFQLRRQVTGDSEFLRHHLHRIVAISVVLRSADRIKTWSLGTPESDERELIQRFFDGVEKYKPTLVSWNGGGFDLPVLHYRSLIHRVHAARYWDVGDDDRDFKYNNYLGRYHWRHIDLMDVLAGYQPRASAPLDEIATLLGFPGKMGMSGDKVWENYCQGNIEHIRNYCETDVLNTYLVYLRFQLMRGHIDDAQYQTECELLRKSIKTENKSHLNSFLDAWPEEK